MAIRLSSQPLAILFITFVRFRENRPTKDYSCKILYQNSNSKCHLYIDYEMVALKTPPLFSWITFFTVSVLICTFLFFCHKSKSKSLTATSCLTAIFMIWVRQDAITANSFDITACLAINAKLSQIFPVRPVDEFLSDTVSANNRQIDFSLAWAAQPSFLRDLLCRVMQVLLLQLRRYFWWVSFEGIGLLS